MRWSEIAGRSPTLDEPVDSNFIITVVMSNDAFAGLQLPIVESQWRPSQSRGLLVRIDPPDPRIKQQRHVHVAREKHTSAKNMQVSWNADGSRHDNKTFNVGLGSQAAYQDAARAALALKPGVTLEWLNPRSELIMLCESMLPWRTIKVIFDLNE